jgi:hypothetical protein
MSGQTSLGTVFQAGTNDAFMTSSSWFVHVQFRFCFVALKRTRPVLVLETWKLGETDYEKKAFRKSWKWNIPPIVMEVNPAG